MGASRSQCQRPPALSRRRPRRQQPQQHRARPSEPLQGRPPPRLARLSCITTTMEVVSAGSVLALAWASVSASVFVACGCAETGLQSATLSPRTHNRVCTHTNARAILVSEFCCRLVCARYCRPQLDEPLWLFSVRNGHGHGHVWLPSHDSAVNHLRHGYTSTPTCARGSHAHVCARARSGGREEPHIVMGLARSSVDGGAVTYMRTLSHCYCIAPDTVCTCYCIAGAFSMACIFMFLSRK